MKNRRKRRSVRTETRKRNGDPSMKFNKNVDAPPINPGIQQVPKSLKELIKLKTLGKESIRNSDKKSERFSKKNKSLLKTDYKNVDQLGTEPAQPANSSIQVNFNLISNSNDLTKKQKLLETKSVSQKKKKKLLKLKLKRKLKRDKKKADIKLEEEMPDIVKEEIKFGEVAHRPPHLTTRPRQASKLNFENRPGRKDDLLLKSLLNQTNSIDRSALCAKRKYLSISDQRQIANERQKAMLSYRHVKMRKHAVKK